MVESLQRHYAIVRKPRVTEKALKMVNAGH